MCISSFQNKDGSVNGKNTMETLNPLYQHTIGQKTGLSFLDVKAINVVYCQGSTDDGQLLQYLK